MLYEMQIKRLILDPITNVPVVILKGVGNDKSLPVWVDVFEANAILSELENVVPSRPMTHDLIRDILSTAEFKVVNVTVTDLVDNTFYVAIELAHDGSTIKVDSRPGDAIAIALRVKAPIFVTDEVISKTNKIEVEKKDDLDKWKEWLQNSQPEDFGKYKM